MALRGTSARALGAALLLVLGGCNNDNPTAPGDISRAVLSVKVDPSPILAEISNPFGPIYTINYTVKLEELAGLGGTVELVDSRVYDDATGGVVAANVYDDKDLVVFIGSNRLDPNGTLDVVHQLSYQLSTADKSTAYLVVNARLHDDKDNLQTQSILTKIQ
jgi:hypothetical protein